MSTQVKCDRCGVLEEIQGVMLFAGLAGPGFPTSRPPLPDGWTRPVLPDPDGQVNKRELCPACKADLILFMGNRPVPSDPFRRMESMCPDCGHRLHDGAVCPELVMPGAPGDVDACRCGEKPEADGG